MLGELKWPPRVILFTLRWMMTTRCESWTVRQAELTTTTLARTMRELEARPARVVRVLGPGGASGERVESRARSMRLHRNS